MSASPDPADTYTTMHVCAGQGFLGRHGDLETPFRRFLAVILRSERVTLPPLLWESLADHRYRADGDGRTLCFAGPLRDQCLDVFTAWLAGTRRQPVAPATQLVLFAEGEMP
jgi:hypothetical protein